MFYAELEWRDLHGETSAVGHVRVWNLYLLTIKKAILVEIERESIVIRIVV
jgi:hypothetical protein